MPLSQNARRCYVPQNICEVRIVNQVFFAQLGLRSQPYHQRLCTTLPE
ncbi:hypothetical protein IQ260_09025 [Leptolyngbya cf. ectocarpi LEGE 11479]|uniref:Uncharacterized protein n=1 Tax=Leptolyngbya cf. ectocarpi LEGE 11479 TaxID=1828722 RepID=A0A928ZTR1_LEPEC|nr:hypothetical protein [Leptolyngbya cf. ectocarpi LEGE 11479]